MVDAATKLPVQKSKMASPPAPSAPSRHDWMPFHALRHEMDRVFDMFGLGHPMRPALARPMLDFDLSMPGSSVLRAGIPAADFVEKDAEYEITAELPGLEPKDIEVKLHDGLLTIKGEKKEDKEERRPEYHLSERRYGSFIRSFSVPRGVDTEHIEAGFAKGVLTLRLPKSRDAMAQEKKIEVKAA